MMTKYFDFAVREEYEGQVQEFLNGIDPYYHRALVVGVHLLSQDQDEPVQDHYFTAIYATIMEMEDIINHVREQNKDHSIKKDYSCYSEKRK